MEDCSFCGAFPHEQKKSFDYSVSAVLDRALLSPDEEMATAAVATLFGEGEEECPYCGGPL